MGGIATPEELWEWVERLWGIEPDRLRSAAEIVRSWGLANLNDVLLQDSTADGVIATMFLAESVAALVEHGVEENRLVSKLRGDLDVWPTWAEITAAARLARVTDDEVQLRMEADRARGRHADFNLMWPGGERRGSIEFKALGLSDVEVAFAQRAVPLLPELLPRVGITTWHHFDLTSEVVQVTGPKRAQARREAEEVARALPACARGTAAAVLIGHGSEDDYVRRLTLRFKEALRQLPEDDECWIVFHWSNGAPFSLVSSALAQAEVPAHVAGVGFIGSVAVPGHFDNFSMFLPAPFGEDPGRQVESAMPEFADFILGLVDQTSGVRPTLWRVPTRNGMCDFVRRGTQRILPYNLLLAPEPDWASRV